MKTLSLEYHDVYTGTNPDASGFPGAGPASYKLPRDKFVHHLAAISETRANVVRIVDSITSDRPEMSLCITFDDGGCGAMDAADALETHGWRGHFFVTAGKIGEPAFLSRTQLGELQRRGHIIGTHSMTHPKMMGALAESVVFDEWRQSRGLLEDAISAPVITASVPGGFFKPHVGRAAATAGVQILFTSSPTVRSTRIDGCWILGRYTIRRGTSATTAAAIAARKLLPRASQSILYGTLTAIRSVTGSRYTRVRDAIWARLGS